MDYSKKLNEIALLDKAIQPIVLAAFLSRLFKKWDVLLTVVGGAAVQYYTQGEYNTEDLDSILSGDTKEIIEEVMGSLGFKRTSMYRHFEHPSFDFVVEFPPSPIEVGNRHVDTLANVETQEGLVRVIRVEDLIMDRIIAGVEWRDPPSLDQARLLWVKNKKRIDLEYLKQFAKEEGYADTLKKILK